MESLTIALGEDIALGFRIDKRAILFETCKLIREINKKNEKKIKLGSRSLVLELARLAADQWNTSSIYDRENKFAVETQTKSLATSLGCTTRTIRNYYCFLIGAGIIELKENIGGKVNLLLSSTLFERVKESMMRKKNPPLVQELKEPVKLNISSPRGKVDKNLITLQERRSEVLNSSTLNKQSSHLETIRPINLSNKEIISNTKEQWEGNFNAEQIDLGNKCWKAIQEQIYNGIYDYSHRNKDWVFICTRLIAFEAVRNGSNFQDSYFDLRRRIEIAAQWLSRKPEITPPPPSFYLDSVADGNFRLTTVKNWENSLRTMKYAKKAQLKILRMCKVFNKGKSSYSMAQLNAIFLKEVESYPILKPWYLENIFHLLTKGNVNSK